MHLTIEFNIFSANTSLFLHNRYKRKHKIKHFSGIGILPKWLPLCSRYCFKYFYTITIIAELINVNLFHNYYKIMLYLLIWRWNEETIFVFYFPSTKFWHRHTSVFSCPRKKCVTGISNRFRVTRWRLVSISLLIVTNPACGREKIKSPRTSYEVRKEMIVILAFLCRLAL